MSTSILVPTDGSKFSDKAIKEAAKLAKESGSKLVLFHAVPYYQLRPLTQGLSAPIRPQEKEKAQKKMEAQAQAVLAAAAKRAHLTNRNVARHFVVSNSPYGAIIAASKKFKCELIVMASHGRRGLCAVLLSSQTQKVLAHSKVPVLVVR